MIKNKSISNSTNNLTGNAIVTIQSESEDDSEIKVYAKENSNEGQDGAYWRLSKSFDYTQEMIQMNNKEKNAFENSKNDLNDSSSYEPSYRPFSDRNPY